MRSSKGLKLMSFSYKSPQFIYHPSFDPQAFIESWRWGGSISTTLGIPDLELLTSIHVHSSIDILPMKEQKCDGIQMLKKIPLLNIHTECCHAISYNKIKNTQHQCEEGEKCQILIDKALDL